MVQATSARNVIQITSTTKSSARSGRTSQTRNFGEEGCGRGADLDLGVPGGGLPICGWPTLAGIEGGTGARSGRTQPAGSGVRGAGGPYRARWVARRARRRKLTEAMFRDAMVPTGKAQIILWDGG
jgi:hypothetical protein